MPRKPDDEAIAAFLDDLAEQSWLDDARRAWTRFVFHFTDVRNLPSVVAESRLLCRARAQATGLIVTDSASAEIIAQTRPPIHDHVRLYFRPRTPTFYRNEGIRPIGARYQGAHCPVPIALVFDAKHVLGLAGTRFSNGSLASGPPEIGDDVAFLRRIPFQHVYHNTAFPAEARDEIVFRRQAEIIVPRELSLDGLRYVYARSVAEFETLTTLIHDDPRIHPPAAAAFLSKLRVNSRSSLFHNKWTYVERVDIVGDFVRITFNPSTETPGPFTARLTWKDAALDQPSVETLVIRAANVSWRHPIPPIYRHDQFRLKLELDDALAYVGQLSPNLEDDVLDIPYLNAP